MAQGESCMDGTNRSSLKFWVRSVSPSTLKPGSCTHGVIGNGECRIVDTWWQTETGGSPDLPLRALPI